MSSLTGFRGDMGEKKLVNPQLLPISPILQDSLDDSVVANVGSSREESSTPPKAIIATQTVVDSLPIGMDSGPDVLSLAGGWSGRAPSLRNVHHRHSVVLVPGAHFRIRYIVPRTMRRHLAFHGLLVIGPGRSMACLWPAVYRTNFACNTLHGLRTQMAAHLYVVWLVGLSILIVKVVSGWPPCAGYFRKCS